MRIKLHYLAMVLVIPFYGIQVCPFIEKLPPLEVYITIGGALLIAFFIRNILIERYIETMPLAGQVWRTFNLELATLISVGIILSIYNYSIHDFPLGSGLKVIVGITAMGLFVSTDSALYRERIIAEKVKKEGIVLEISEDFFPLSSKLAFYAGAYVFLIIGVFVLLVIKDLDWIVTVGDDVTLEDARISILKEFAFVLVIALIETVNIILSFSNNLSMFLNRENSVLINIASGFYDNQVPVSSNDEFGVMAKHTNEMIKQIRERTQELNITRDVSILTLASLAETRDNETGAHILRTQRYVKALAKQLQAHPRFSDELDDDCINLLYKSAPLHDIGKVGIPDEILLKPGKLTDDEFEIMKGHARIGADALKVAEKELGTNSFLRLARTISLTHHEKWDGSGYPEGLSGDDIPIAGRLMAVADVYDALITKRVYKPAFSHEKAMSIIRQGRDQHFDPDIIDALNIIENQFIEIAKEFCDVKQGENY